MTTTEREFSFCFSYDTENDFILSFFQQALFNGEKLTWVKTEVLKDYYLSEDVRLRYLESPETCWLFKKSGDKATQREEASCQITPELYEDFFNIMNTQIKLRIEKTRQIYKIKGWNMEFVIDVITKPMRLKMVEIECDEPTFHRLAQYMENIKNLKRNTRNAWSYFHRKIGFAGTPSSGKSTLCRSLVNKLSIDYGISTEQITEYARTHIARYGVPEWYIQPQIEWGQERRENDAKDSVVMVTDSPRFLPYMYLMFNHKEKMNKTSINMYAKVYKAALSATATYTDLVLLNQQEVKQDGVRYQSNDDATVLFSWIEVFLKQHKFEYIRADYTLNLDKLIKDMFSINDYKTMWVEGVKNTHYLAHEDDLC